MESAYAAAGVTRFAAWAHESDEAMRADLERRGCTLDTWSRAMGMPLGDIRLCRPDVELGPPDWLQYLRILGVPSGFLSGANRAAYHVLVARLGGENVATAMAFDRGADCGIYNVTTLEHARRRGLGTALTTIHVHDASRVDVRPPACCRREWPSACTPRWASATSAGSSSTCPGERRSSGSWECSHPNAVADNAFTGADAAMAPRGAACRARAHCATLRAKRTSLDRSATEPMPVTRTTSQQVSTFCALCVSRCGAKATIAADGGFAALRPDPSHPTGRALCVKGKAAPEIVSHAERLLHPLKRTNPKGADDPGWQRIGWDEALDTVAARLRSLARDHGPESVVFATASPSTSAMSDSVDWVMRLRRAFGSPNQAIYMELCGWGRYLASIYTYGESVPGAYMPDLDHAGCILYWGYNPSVARLAHATGTVAALRRGARLVVVDPRRAGLARDADHWLRVRPGTDAALALSLTHVMIEHGWYDEDFVRRWTDAPLLVRSDTQRLLRADDLSPEGDPAHYVAWDDGCARPVVYDPDRGRHAVDEAQLALLGAPTLKTRTGAVKCRPVFDLVAERCRQMPPSVAEEITGVAASDIERTARTLWESRPLAFYAWSGLEQHSNTTQTIRAINQLYALTGCFDARGGNVLFAGVPSNRIDGAELLAPRQRAKALGVEERPLGPARFEFITGEDLYTAALEGRPYRGRGLVSFGANLMMAHGDSARGRDALAALDFFVHADLFMNPTAELADLVLPVTSPFESEGLKIGFEVSADAQSLVQLRRPLVPARGEARSDLQIIFALATRLGLGEHFWGGDLDAAWRHQLAPSGVTLEQLRSEPAGVRVPLTTRHRKYAELDGDAPRGFRTPSRKVELYSEVLAEHGYPSLPDYEEPRTSPRSRPDLAQRFPLILTCAKSLWFCETQHRNVASLRSRVPDPQVEMHPEAALARGIEEGDWVRLHTPHGSVRARAKLTTGLDARVVCGQHGWWQACQELGLPGYPPLGPGSANLNAALSQRPSDAISGSSPLRASVCDVSLLS
jgi:anaerobic selenocysteine-containing dehydrogenase